MNPGAGHPRPAGRTVTLPLSTSDKACCRVIENPWQRQAPLPAQQSVADAAEGACGKPPIELITDPQRGFLKALGEIFAIAVTADFPRLVVVDRLTTGGRFRRDPGHRAALLSRCCELALDGPGLLVLWPAPGMWSARRTAARRTGPRPASSRRLSFPEELELCQLLGQGGFAQLCDPAIPATTSAIMSAATPAPIPLFVRPWCPHRGLLLPQRWPIEAFSAALKVHRLPHGRMVLIDPAARRSG